MPNVPVNNSYPAVEFQPTEPNSVYHTDQEFTDSSANSYMFRTYNAQFITGFGWQLFDNSLPAYATVQNPDGSIHYYTNPSGMTIWTAWVGSDNNTVYNAVDFGAPPLTAGISASPSDNTAALTTMFTAMASAPTPGLPGGMAWIPQYNFPVEATSSGVNVPSGCVVQGLGSGGYRGTDVQDHFTIYDGTGGCPYTFLTLSGGTHTSAGATLRNLCFQWSGPGCAGTTPDTCLKLEGWGNAVYDCTFVDCPTAISITQLGHVVSHCTIAYGVVTRLNGVTAVLMSGINCELVGPCELNGNHITDSTTNTAVSIGGSSTDKCNLNTIRKIHMPGWNYGIDYGDVNNTGIGSATQYNTIEDCNLDCSVTCINLQPNTSSGKIYDQKFLNNTLRKSADSTQAGSIVWIDSNSGAVGNVGPVSFVNNVVFSDVTGGSGQGGSHMHTGKAQTNQYGVQIGDCESVVISGGQISQVGTYEYAGDDGTANICISGAPSSVIIGNVNLNGIFTGANFGNATGTMGSAASEYAVLISGTPSYVQIDNCLMTNVTGYALSVTGTPGALYVSNCVMTAGAAVSITGSVALSKIDIRNCQGYNDQNTVINTLAHIGTATPYSAATQGSNSGTSYYGPSFVMFTANSISGGSFQVNGGVPQTPLVNQIVTVFLDSPYDTIQFNGHAPVAFTWIGK